jgi:hypothetical protein
MTKVLIITEQFCECVGCYQTPIETVLLYPPNLEDSDVVEMFRKMKNEKVGLTPVTKRQKKWSWSNREFVEYLVNELGFVKVDYDEY